MPKLTNERLETAAPQAFNSPNTTSDIGAGIALAKEGIAGLADSFMAFREQKDAGVLAKYEEEAAAAVESASAYNVVKAEILSRARGADKERFAALDMELQALRRGEVQGTISPQVAAVTLARLSKNYQKLRPGLGAEIRRLTSAYLGEVASIQSLDDLDPVAKAQEQIWQEATARGWTYDAVVAYNNDLAAAQQAKNTAEMKLANGDADASKFIADFVTNSATLVNMREQWENLDVGFKNGTFVKEDALKQLGVMRGQLYNEFMQQASTWEAEGSIILRDKSKLFAEVSKPLDILEALIPNIDSSDKNARLSRNGRVIIDNNKVKALYDVLGEASIFATTPEGAIKVVEDMAGISKRLMSGQLATIERLAQLDPYTRMLLDSMRRGEGWGVLAKGVVDRAEGTPASKLPPGFAREADNIVWKRAGAPGSALADRQKVFTNMLNGMHPIEGLHRNLDLVEDVITNDVGAQNIIERRMVSAISNTVRKVDAQVLNSMSYDPGKGFVYNGPQQEGIERNPFYIEWDMYEDPIRTKKSAGAQAAEYLNMYVDILKTYMPPDAAHDFVTANLKDALEARYSAVSNEHRGIINRNIYDLDEEGMISVNGKVDPNWAPTTKEEAIQVIGQLTAKYPDRADDFRALFPAE